MLGDAWDLKAGRPTQPRGGAYGDSQGNWGLLQVRPKANGRLERRGVRDAERLHVGRSPRVETRRWEQWRFRVE